MRMESCTVVGLRLQTRDARDMKSGAMQLMGPEVDLQGISKCFAEPGQGQAKGNSSLGVKMRSR